MSNTSSGLSRKITIGQGLLRLAMLVLFCAVLLYLLFSIIRLGVWLYMMREIPSDAVVQQLQLSGARTILFDVTLFAVPSILLVVLGIVFLQIAIKSGTLNVIKVIAVFVLVFQMIAVCILVTNVYYNFGSVDVALYP